MTETIGDFWMELMYYKPSSGKYVLIDDGAQALKRNLESPPSRSLETHFLHSI
ncbi:MAG: hypothetical protein P8N19_12055 [Flavobacteriales bacterium]|nr:hypothetical protein [Flavobacteriales bacterium]MDG1766539.1 hypothetical protein [Flavobacteriales bacterium]